jgi:uncharacterized OsmC-like protein
MRVDLAKLADNVNETAARLAEDSAAGHVRPNVQTRLIANVQAQSDFVQYGKQFSFRCDESDDRAGTGEAPSPLRYFLSGIAFCQQVWYAKGAALVGCPIEELEIDVRTYMDMRGEHHVDDVVAHPQWIAIEARVTSPGSSEQVLAMVDEANSRCPVYSLVSLAVPVYERIHHNGTVVRDTIPEGLEAS